MFTLLLIFFKDIYKTLCLIRFNFLSLKLISAALK